MPEAGRKAKAAWAEFKESWQMILDIEMEGLKLTEVEADKNFELNKEKLGQVEGLLKEEKRRLEKLRPPCQARRVGSLAASPEGAIAHRTPHPSRMPAPTPSTGRSSR